MLYYIISNYNISFFFVYFINNLTILLKKLLHNHLKKKSILLFMIEGSYISENGYCIPKDNMTVSQLNIIKKELTVLPLNIDYTAEEKEKAKYKVYSIVDGIVRIPRYYGIQKFGDPEKTTFKVVKPTKIKFKGILRDYQVPIVDTCMAHIKEKGGGLLVVPCATGKTSMSIYIASQLKAKTLVITHKTFLQDQWIARCKQFTNSEIGIIRQDKVDIEGKDFVIAMIQSLSKRNYDPEIFKQFQFIICDETHHFSSRCFSQALAKCGARYTMGLTATPYRGDGLMHVVNWYLGDVMYEKKIKTNNQVVSKIITFHSTDKSFRDKKRWIQGKIRPDCVKMINTLCKVDEKKTNIGLVTIRNKHICDIVSSLMRTGERKILILSGRKEHLNELKKIVDTGIKKDIEHGLIEEDDCKTYFYTGDTKRADRFEAEQYADIIFATYDMAQEGLDIDRLNTIILATPKPDVNQAVGRILRKVLANGDIRPLVIDIVDKLNVFLSQSARRETFYDSSKYVSQYYYISDDKFLSPYDYLKLCGETNENLDKTAPLDFNSILEVLPVDIDENPVTEVEARPTKKKGGGVVKKIKKYEEPSGFMF
jgi:superfamily II DNA or RNA helicase